MTQFIAVASLVVLAILNQLGMFWFVYGVWPRSWGALALFGLTGTVISVAMTRAMKADE